MPKKIRLSTDKVVAIAAIVISVCALVTTVYQTIILKKEQHASVWPRISLLHTWRTGTNESHYRLTLSNLGLGPAIIEDYKIIHKDSSFVNFASLSKNIAKEAGLADSLAYEDYMDLFGDQVVPHNKTFVVLYISNKNQIEAFLKELKHIHIEIKYKSLYDDTFQVEYPNVNHKTL
ncbi:hypothetical protein GCM10009117_05630 [Gangjinia marincola]|uniref:Uncharacterized protein n=1 Tax=Gangjinia marincola TaxID=578463 RepID=A0ABN1MEA5_9FLAO